MYIESLVKRNTCGLLVPITANEARTLSDTPPVAHASSLTTYGLSASGIYGHVKPAESLPLSNSGIGSVGVAVSIFARADHRHPEITSVLQASRLVAGRLVGLGGGVVAPAVSFSGESDLILDITHVNSDYLVGLVPVDVLPVGPGSDEIAAGNHTHLYAGSATAGGPATTAVTATNISGGTVSCTTLSASSTSSLVGNVGIGTSSIINSKLYIFLDKSISSTGSYYGQYNNAKFSTSIASGTRHGTGLYCLTEATGGTLTKLNCIDSKIIIASGSTAEDTFGICTSLFLDGGSTGTYYGLYMGREGTSTPDTYNYGIYQADSEATNIFKGYCRFEGGTNIDGGAGGRVRNFRVMSGTGTINHVKGTDTLVLYSNDGEYGSLGNKTLTLPLGSNNVETGDLIWVYFCGGDTLFFTTSTPNKIKKFTYDSNAQNFIMSTWQNEGSFPVIIHCLWDGEFWRLSYCALGI